MADEDILIDRAAGAIVGVFIGNALGVGVHWQYDLAKLAADRGYVKDFLDPLPGTYHAGDLRAGQLEVQGSITKILLESLATKGGLDQGDFHERFEAQILRDHRVDGTRKGGPFGWTDKVVCDIYKSRVVEGRDWPECAQPRSDTPDAVVRGALVAARYHETPRQLCRLISAHAKAQTGDSGVQAHSVAFGCILAAVIHGHALDDKLGSKLYKQCGTALPFSSMYSEEDFDAEYGHYSEPDPLLWLSNMASGVCDPAVGQSIEPAHAGIQMYGKFCAYYAVLPSAYYCCLRFPDDFEGAVLCAVNGGGSNTTRASLVGALLGARVGLKALPPRLLAGLDDSGRIVAWALQVARDATRAGTPAGEAGRAALDAEVNAGAVAAGDDEWAWPE